MRLCVLCDKGKCRTSKTLCDRCLRDWLKRQAEREELRASDKLGVIGTPYQTWTKAQWREHQDRMIEYLEELERNG